MLKNLLGKTKMKIYIYIYLYILNWQKRYKAVALPHLNFKPRPVPEQQSFIVTAQIISYWSVPLEQLLRCVITIN